MAPSQPHTVSPGLRICFFKFQKEDQAGAPSTRSYTAMRGDYVDVAWYGDDGEEKMHGSRS